MKNLNTYLQQADSREVKTWITSNLNNYLTNNAENQGEIEHILDYLNSSEAPNRLRKMSYSQAKKGSITWVEKMTKKAQGIVETEEDTKTIIDFGDGMKLVELKGEASFKREGNLMSHCVGSYYGKKGIKVLSLRDVRNNPHCTIEIQGSGEEINQIKGKGNGSIHPKYINYVIKTLNHLGQKIRPSEMENLGYSKLDDDVLMFIESSFKGAKFTTFGGEKYFYNNSKLSPVKGE